MSPPADLPGHLLVIGLSARALAQSARRAGIGVVALDLYGDADTGEYADVSATIAAGADGFDGPALLDAAARLAPLPDFPLVYGSGFEGAPGLLADLARGRRLLGNPPELIRHIKAPDAFFPLLDRLKIPYPAVRQTPPPDPENWLIKAGCGEGGKRVRFCAHENPAGPGEYYQRRLPEPALSALFLANGSSARIVGFNTLETVRRGLRSFGFGGALNRAPLDERQRHQVERHVDNLARATGLVGLNSLDFMLEDGVPKVLEINPRPSATLALYDADFPEGILASHLRACGGSLDDVAEIGRRVRGFKVALAPAALVIPDTVAWPDWCADRPRPGSHIGPGKPFCTLTAEGDSTADVQGLLARRRAEIFARFMPPPEGSSRAPSRSIP